MSETLRTPSPFRRRSHRRSILRTLPLSPIGDIAQATFTQGTSESITWSAQTDWDNAVTTENVDPVSGIIDLGVGNDSFEDLSNGDPLPAWYDTDNTSGISNSVGASEGSLAVDDNSNNTSLEVNNIGGVEPDVVTWAYYETSNSTGLSFEIRDSGGSQMIACGTSNPGVGYEIQGSNYDITSSPSPNYDEWRRLTFTIDWAGGTVDVLWEDLTGSTGDYTDSHTHSFNPFTDTIQGVLSYSWAGGADGDGTACWVDEIWGAYYDGFLESATKSFSSSVAPDLTNLSYTLNGETIVLDVIGSPGTASEEVKTQTLDGSSGYTLSWSNTHSDFRIRPNLSTTDRSGASTPTVDSITLKE